MKLDKTTISLIAVGFIYGAFCVFYFWIPIEMARSIGPTFNNVLFALTAPGVIGLMVSGSIIAEAIPRGIQFYVLMALNGVIWAALLLVCKILAEKAISLRHRR